MQREITIPLLDTTSSVHIGKNGQEYITNSLQLDFSKLSVSVSNIESLRVYATFSIQSGNSQVLYQPSYTARITLNNMSQLSTYRSSRNTLFSTNELNKILEQIQLMSTNNTLTTVTLSINTVEGESPGANQPYFYYSFSDIVIKALIDIPDIDSISSSIIETGQSFIVTFSDNMSSNLSYRLYLSTDVGSIYWSLRGNNTSTQSFSLTGAGANYLIEKSNASTLQGQIFYRIVEDGEVSDTTSSAITVTIKMPEALTANDLTVSLQDISDSQTISKTLIPLKNKIDTSSANSGEFCYANLSLLQLTIQILNGKENQVKTISCKDSTGEPLQNVLTQSFIPTIISNSHTITVTINTTRNTTIKKTVSYKVRQYTGIQISTLTATFQNKDDSQTCINFALQCAGTNDSNVQLGIGTFNNDNNHSWNLIQDSNNQDLRFDTGYNASTSTFSSISKQSKTVYSPAETHSFDIILIPITNTVYSREFVLASVTVAADKPIIDFFQNSNITSIGLGGAADENQSNITCHLPLITFANAVYENGSSSSTSSTTIDQTYTMKMGRISAGVNLGIANENAIISVTQIGTNFQLGTTTINVGDKTMTVIGPPSYFLKYDNNDWQIIEEGVAGKYNGNYGFAEGPLSDQQSAAIGAKYFYIAYIPTT